jgi:hypothetical protein
MVVKKINFELSCKQTLELLWFHISSCAHLIRSFFVKFLRRPSDWGCKLEPTSERRMFYFAPASSDSCVSLQQPALEIVYDVCKSLLGIRVYMIFVFDYRKSPQLQILNHCRTIHKLSVIGINNIDNVSYDFLFYFLHKHVLHSSEWTTPTFRCQVPGAHDKHMSGDAAAIWALHFPRPHLRQEILDCCATLELNFPGSHIEHTSPPVLFL